MTRSARAKAPSRRSGSSTRRVTMSFLPTSRAASPAIRAACASCAWTRVPAGPKLGEEAGQRARVQPGGPGDRVHADAVAHESGGQLAPGAGDHDLLDVAQPRQLAREQPDLALPASPLASRRDVDDANRHASRATAASRVLSSARLKGLWR